MEDRGNSSGWATYFRVSDEDKQTPERSFAMQRQRIQEQLIEGSNLSFRKEYRDMLTGTSPNRSDYLQMIADAEAGNFSHLGLYRADRFGRNTVEGLQAATKLIGLGIKIRMAHMPSLMPETPDGFFMFLIQMGMAQREVEILRQRTTDGIEAKLRAGGWAFKAPEGYINKERLVSSNKYDRWVEQNPNTIQMVREAFDLLLTGRFTMAEICDELARRGYTRGNGKPWAWIEPKTGERAYAIRRIFDIFHNPFYAGWVVSQRLGIGIGEVRGQWEPIITHSEYMKGLEILRKSDENRSRKRRHFYLLRGLLWLEMQGKQYKMTGSSPRTRSRWFAYYATLTKPNGKDLNIPCEQVDPLVPAWLQGIAVDQDKIPSIRQVYQSEVAEYTEKDKEDHTQKIKAKLTQLRDEEARLGRLFITGRISEETYEQLRREWQEKLHDTEEKLVEVERTVRSLMLDLDLALILLSKLPVLFSRLEKEKQALLLKIIAKRIIINPDGQIIDQELHSPFTYLLRIAFGFEEPCIPCRRSEQIRLGALLSEYFQLLLILADPSR